MFVNDFNDIEDLKREFRLSDEQLDGFEILLASYVIDGYDGSAYVLMRKDGCLYEVEAGHCSCFGLEDGWDVEATTIEAIEKRLRPPADRFGEAVNYVRIVIDQLKKENTDGV